jgi:hypothetical protein
MASNDVINYVRYVTGSGLINNHKTLEKQIINVNIYANVSDTYTSNVDIDYKAGSDNYTVTINDDDYLAFMHKAIYWDNYKFINGKLEFEQDGKKIFISNK